MLCWALSCANAAKWHLDLSWLRACKKLCLHPPTYTLLFIQAPFPGVSLKCKQAMLNISHQSARDPVWLGRRVTGAENYIYNYGNVYCGPHEMPFNCNGQDINPMCHMICSSSLGLLTPRPARRAKLLLRSDTT